MSTRHVGLAFVLVLAAAVSPVLAQTFPATRPVDLSSLAGWKGAAPRSPDAFTFVVVSDRNGGNIPGQWAAAVQQVNLLQPDFVICVGDLINGYTEDVNELTRQWDEFDAMTRKFDAPFFYCPGNHDVSNDEMWKFYVPRHGVKGKSYYSFDYRGCHFVVLDSTTAQDKTEFADEQFAWLAKDITGAKEAKHVFVFYHHPLWKKAHLWKRLRELLPAEKTTIFNGHWHDLSFERPDGIETYVLSATGAEVSDIQFRMFAQVAVNRGKPTIALIPLHKILPGAYAQFHKDVEALVSTFSPPVAISGVGGSFTFNQENAFAFPIKVELKSQSQGWALYGETGALTIEAGERLEKDFVLVRTSSGSLKPEVSARYEFAGPYAGVPMEVTKIHEFPTYARMDIPRVTNVKVDGDLGDLEGIKPLRVAESERIHKGAQNWSGPEDASFKLRIGTDGERLFVGVDVTDEQISLGAVNAWENDGIEFFWDARAPEKRGTPPSLGIGQLILAVPEEGKEADPVWKMRGRPVPEGLILGFKRREGGYIFELSIPLSELRIPTPLSPDQTVNLEAEVNDWDVSEGKASWTHMTTSGVGHSHYVTGGYARCTFK